MSQHSYEMTGVLVLEKVTPVIRALFSTYRLDGDHPGHGEAYIAYRSETSSNYWSEVVESLAELIMELGLNAPHDESDVIEHLRVLATHFGCDQDEAVLDLINVHEDQADVEHLFELALRFDDGHGLTAVDTESAWHCSKLRLYEFGGIGEYRGRHFMISTASSHASTLGREIEARLAVKDIDAAAQSVFGEVQNLLAGITDKALMKELRAKLGALVVGA